MNLDPMVIIYDWICPLLLVFGYLGLVIIGVRGLFRYISRLIR